MFTTNSIQNAHVEKILDSVLSALSDTNTTQKRTFTYVETKFFSKWYTSLSVIRRQLLKHLIAKKQWSFSNGGWSMHDEANSHYMGMIDQTTLGHTFLKKELDVVPKVGWQLDPFGHSTTQGSLMTSGVGFDALYFGRIHYVDLENRKQKAGKSALVLIYLMNAVFNVKCLRSECISFGLYVSPFDCLTSRMH